MAQQTRSQNGPLNAGLSDSHRDHNPSTRKVLGIPVSLILYHHPEADVSNAELMRELASEFPLPETHTAPYNPHEEEKKKNALKMAIARAARGAPSHQHTNQDSRRGESHGTESDGRGNGSGEGGAGEGGASEGNGSSRAYTHVAGDHYWRPYEGQVSHSIGIRGQRWSSSRGGGGIRGSMRGGRGRGDWYFR